MGAVVFGLIALGSVALAVQPTDSESSFLFVVFVGLPLALSACGIVWLRPMRILEVDESGLRLLRKTDGKRIKDLPWGEITKIVYGRKIFLTGRWSSTEGHVLSVHARNPCRRISLDDVYSDVSTAKLGKATSTIVKMGRARAIAVRTAQKHGPARRKDRRPGPNIPSEEGRGTESREQPLFPQAVSARGRAEGLGVVALIGAGALLIFYGMSKGAFWMAGLGVYIATFSFVVAALIHREMDILAFIRTWEPFLTSRFVGWMNILVGVGMGIILPVGSLSPNTPWPSADVILGYYGISLGLTQMGLVQLWNFRRTTPAAEEDPAAWEERL
jgi:hypothetical protein